MTAHIVSHSFISFSAALLAVLLSAQFDKWSIPQVLSDLKCVEKSDDPDSSFAVGFGMHYKIMDLKAGFNPLDTKEVCRAYRNARHRLILLDWGGTLVATQEKSDKLQAYAMATGHAERDSLSPELRAVLEILASDVKNTIFVVSGKEQPAVAQYFGSIKVPCA